ncbi:hypothetical protein DGWBC_1455 [Dehalogenimonas sp. WBC-2]|nr:hypothetical protein DGWBC_1455 [Dehalogenimonas sp. WBC-2]
MKMPEYVSKNEVERVCKELGFKNWAQMKTPSVQDTEASVILKMVNTAEMDIPLEEFKQGLVVELEHGTMYEDANVTNNHPILTGLIVLAHLKETMDYYERLDVVEIEGDILKATLAGDLKKADSKYRKLAQAKSILADSENNKLNSSH